MQLYQGKDDCQWLLDTHLRSDMLAPGTPEPKKFNSFILEGNEDYPTKIHIYAKENPEITDHCDAYKLNKEGFYEFVGTIRTDG
jgi:hypothetical protein